MSNIILQLGINRLAKAIAKVNENLKDVKSKDDLTTYPSDNDFLKNTKSGAIGLKEVNGHPNIIVNFAGSIGEWPELNNLKIILQVLEDRLQKQIDINFNDIQLNKDEIVGIKAIVNALSGGIRIYHYGTLDDANTAKATINFNESDIAWIGTSGNWVGYHFINGNWVANNTTSTHVATLDAYTKAETNAELAKKQNVLTAAQLEILKGIKFTQVMLDKINSALQAHQDISGKQDALTPEQLAVLAGKVFTEAEKTELAHFIQFKAAIDLAINHSAKFSHLPANTNDELAKKQNLLTAAQLAIINSIAFTQADKDKIDGMDAKYISKTFKFKPHASKQPNLIVLNNNGISALPVNTKITLDLGFINELLGTPATVPAAGDQLFIGGEAVRIPNAVGTAALKWETKTNPTDINIKENYLIKDIVLQKVNDNGTIQWNFVELADKEVSYIKDDLSNLDPVALLAKEHEIDDMTDFTTTLVNIPAYLFEHAELKSINGQNIKKIGTYAFNHYIGTSLDLPKVEYIAERAFANAKLITTVNLPEVLELGSYALSASKGITTLNIPKVKTIGDGCFRYYSGTTLDLPEVLEIGYQAFSDAKKLTTLNIPKVQTIGNNAFYNIVNAPSTTVTIPAQFNTDAEKNRIFHTNWSNITFTYSADTSASNPGGTP